MDIISILKARREAASECIGSDIVEEADKSVLIKGEQFLEYSYYISKGLIAIDWKKQVPITKRQIPFAFLAFGLCAVSDYAASEYIFKQNEQILLKYTGFKDGIYVNPNKFMKMRSSFQTQARQIYQENEDDLMDQV